ncbi:MAG TPA: T9SS type A sorting domain-containing protein, partial [Chitinophagales bacterium]|nr:T9SS type A sorting domain-containing protein [Chitinophagales bacterium]
DLTITSSSIPAADVNQGTTSVIVYAAKMVDATEPVTVNNITFTLEGTHDNNDLTTAAIYYNPNTPDLIGASFLNSTAATFAGPHTYSVSINRTLALGEDGFFVITVNISSTGTDNKTVQVNGATNPVTFGYTTAPNVDNQQSNKAKAQKIQAADLTITTNSIPAADVNQGTTSVIVYAAKMVDATEPVTVNNITFTLDGTHDNNDLTTAAIYYNPNTPDLIGASFLNSTTATFAAPHAYSVSINRTLALGEDGYFVITVNISATGTDNETVLINGETNPVTFGYTTAPNVDDQQSDKAKAQKIQAADLTLSTVTIAAGNILQGSSSNIVYAVKMVDATEPVTVNGITFTLSGTHDNTDLTTAAIYYNPNTPDLVGASFLNSTTATFAGPHAYTVSINRTLALGEDGYFVITVNVNATATINNTVTINGNNDPVTFTYTTAPNVVNNQGNQAGVKTIKASGPLKTAPESNVTLQNIYPNPAAVAVNYSLSVQEAQSVTVQLVNQQGKILSGEAVMLSTGINNFNLDVSSLPNGIYFLIASGDDHTIRLTERIVVQH